MKLLRIVVILTALAAAFAPAALRQTQHSNHTAAPVCGLTPIKF